MKKTLLFLLCLGMAVSASAQFTVNPPQTTPTTPTPTAGTTAGHSVNTVDEDIFSRVVLSYSPITRVMEKGTDKTKYNMLALGWVVDKAVARFPLYIEFGFGANWYFAQDKEDGLTSKFNLVSLSIPVNISYRLSLCNGKMHLAPYAGIYFRGNLFGQDKYEYDGDSEKADLFSKDDMGEDYVWKRFQMGWQGGLAFDFNKFFCHVGYTYDFLSLTKNNNSSMFAGPSFGIGFLF